jgi:single-strand DNA-binding protein
VNTGVWIGNLTDDPEMRYTESGKAVTSFSIAINNGRDSNGEERPPTYLDIVAWERLAETTAEFLSKGKKCAVEGSITVDKYTDKEGNKRTKWRIRARNVEFLSPREDRDDDEPRRRPANNSRPASRRPAPVDDDLSDLPF